MELLHQRLNDVLADNSILVNEVSNGLLDSGLPPDVCLPISVGQAQLVDVIISRGISIDDKLWGECIQLPSADWRILVP